MNQEAEELGNFRVVPNNVVVYVLCAMDVEGTLRLEQVCEYIEGFVSSWIDWQTIYSSLDV